MTDLRDTLVDMFTPIPKRLNKFLPSDTRPKAAPTQWDFVKDDPSKFAATWDFEVSGSAIIPLSDAAKAWVYSKLPDGLTLRWDFKADAFGYDVGAQWIKYIVHMASKDRLISEDDYRQAQEEMSRLQWER